MRKWLENRLTQPARPPSWPPGFPGLSDQSEDAYSVEMSLFGLIKNFAPVARVA